MDYNIIRTNFNEINPLPQEGVQLTPQVAQSLYLFTELFHDENTHSDLLSTRELLWRFVNFFKRKIMFKSKPFPGETARCLQIIILV